MNAATEPCPAHGTTIVEGLCPDPLCERGSIAPRVTFADGSQMMRTLSRAGVYAWKPVRTKGHCAPCAARRRRL